MEQVYCYADFRAYVKDQRSLHGDLHPMGYPLSGSTCPLAQWVRAKEMAWHVCMGIDELTVYQFNFRNPHHATVDADLQLVIAKIDLTKDGLINGQITAIALDRILNEIDSWNTLERQSQ